MEGYQKDQISGTLAAKVMVCRPRAFEIWYSWDFQGLGGQGPGLLKHIIDFLKDFADILMSIIDFQSDCVDIPDDFII